MAESEHNREDVTCSICVELFREPVVLPCQHSFCRQCLGLYADKCKPRPTEDTSCTARSEDVHQTISCPVCRAKASLGREGVAGLLVNLQLKEIVERFNSYVKVGDNTPFCSLCEEDNKAKAVKFCTTCGALYCNGCLTISHPNRGPLKRHRLISTEEYVSQGNSRGHVNRDEESNQQPPCTRHGLTLGLYCVTCRLVICMECVVDHPEHSTRDIPSAAEKDKPTVLNKTSKLEEILQQTKESLSRFITLNDKIQENQDLHNKEVEKAYNAALKDLNAWKLNSLDDIKARYSHWSVQCSTIIKHLRVGTDEMERMVQASKDLLSSKDVAFLQDCEGVTKAIDDQVTQKRGALEKHEANRQALSDCVERDLVVPRYMTVKETAQNRHGVKGAIDGQLTSLHVKKPTLKFTETSDCHMRITDEGSVANSHEGYLSWCGAVTDGRWLAGRYYWELQITPSGDCYGHVGVVKEGCGLRQDIEPGSWFIRMEYYSGKVRCYSHCDVKIKPDYQEWRPHTGPHHLGVYLDCDQRSLTVLDCGHNQVMATVRGLEVTKPLVPWVRFSGRISMSARLVTGDSATLPQILCDMSFNHFLYHT